MTRRSFRIMLVPALAALMLTAVLADNIFSRENTGYSRKGGLMNNYMDMPVSGKLERATFALG